MKISHFSDSQLAAIVKKPIRNTELEQNIQLLGTGREN